MGQQLFFFFDDSGVLHRNEESGYFVYAGFAFCSRQERNSAKRKYIRANKDIKRATNLSGEIKAAGLPKKYKRSLFNSVREYETVSACVNIGRVYDYILDSKKSICRYKDYVLKLCVKRKIEDLISKGAVNANEDVEIFIYIDEQLTATNGYYNLQDSIVEELKYGIVNFNYGIVHPHVFNEKVIVHIQYCESKNNYLIQASDILANRIRASYRDDDLSLRKISNHTLLTFP